MMMNEANISTARREIHHALNLCNFCTRVLGISFIDELPKSMSEKLLRTTWFIVLTCAISALIVAEFAYVTSLLVNSTSVAEFFASLHIVGYGIMGIARLLTIWYKRHVFRQLLTDLEEIWPVDTDDKEATEIKRGSLTALRFGQICYMFVNIFGFSLYFVPYICLYLYRLSQGTKSDLGFVWHALYPFDKTKPIYHEFVYAFEVFAGIPAVFGMLSSDMIFTTMASHISMLLRLLQLKIRNVATSKNNTEDAPQTYWDCYEDILVVIKLHQRLISYYNDLEDVFSIVNLMNVMLSSINICCVVFNIVIMEPWMDMRHKFFLGAALIQVGMICWYADDLYGASVGVADAVYESGWYNSNARCRRALLLLLQRSQKPLYFTAFKFRNITMATYTSIITTSYSYFALLYTVYRK